MGNGFVLRIVTSVTVILQSSLLESDILTVSHFLVIRNFNTSKVLFISLTSKQGSLVSSSTLGTELAELGTVLAGAVLLGKSQTSNWHTESLGR